MQELPVQLQSGGGDKPKKRKKNKKKQDSPTDSIASLNTELRKCRLEMDGPFLDRDENRKLR